MYEAGTILYSSETDEYVVLLTEQEDKQWFGVYFQQERADIPVLVDPTHFTKVVDSPIGLFTQLVLHTYQHKNLNPGSGVGLLGVVLGLSSESGELAQIIRKKYESADSVEQGILSYTERQQVLKELGDIFYYMLLACINLRVTFQELWHITAKKLMSRQNKEYYEIYRKWFTRFSKAPK